MRRGRASVINLLRKARLRRVCGAGRAAGALGVTVELARKETLGALDAVLATLQGNVRG